MKYTRFLALRIKNYLDIKNYLETVIRFYKQSIHERNQTSKRETTQQSAAKLEASEGQTHTSDTAFRHLPPWRKDVVNQCLEFGPDTV